MLVAYRLNPWRSRKVVYPVLLASAQWQIWVFTLWVKFSGWIWEGVWVVALLQLFVHYLMRSSPAASLGKLHMQLMTRWQISHCFFSLLQCFYLFLFCLPVDLQGQGLSFYSICSAVGKARPLLVSEAAMCYHSATTTVTAIAGGWILSCVVLGLVWTCILLLSFHVFLRPRAVSLTDLSKCYCQAFSLSLSLLPSSCFCWNTARSAGRGNFFQVCIIKIIPRNTMCVPPSFPPCLTLNHTCNFCHYLVICLAASTCWLEFKNNRGFLKSLSFISL